MAQEELSRNLYFKEVGRLKVPGKTAADGEEEKALFTAYRAALAEAESALDGASRSRAERRANGLKNTIAQRYVRFVIKVAKRKSPRNEELFFDLINEGNLGLLRGIEKFDPEYGTRFLSYGTWWIKVFMQERLNKQDAVHVPSHTRKQMRKKRNADDKLRAQGADVAARDVIEPTVANIDDVSVADPDVDVERDAFSKSYDVREFFDTAKLTLLERVVLTYMFGLRDSGESKTPAEISQILYEMDMSQVLPHEVTRICTTALARLKDELEDVGVETFADVFA